MKKGFDGLFIHNVKELYSYIYIAVFANYEKNVGTEILYTYILIQLNQ